jgi:hypothetical protein
MYLHKLELWRFLVTKFTSDKIEYDGKVMWKLKLYSLG